MAPSATVKRPAQYKQSSRKGKKAWRKNIDLTDIEQSIETKKEHEITHGTSDIGSLKDDALFQVDEAGDKTLKSKLIKRKQIKKNLKSKEILDAVKTNSKVGAIKHLKHNEKNKGKIQTVSKKELKKLMALAGKIDGESKIKNHVARDGLIKSDSRDLWGVEKVTKVVTPAGISIDVNEKVEIPETLLKNSTTGWSIASVKPKTLDNAPIQVREYEEIPHAGKSYNPHKADWSNLIEKEYSLEKVREANRIAIQEYRQRIQKLMDVLDDSEEEVSSDEDEENEGEENEDKTISDRLSINEVVKNKKKTKRQRNRAKVHEEKIKLQQEVKKLKAMVRDLENLEETERLVQQENEQKQSGQSVEKKNKVNKKHKLGTKYSAREDNLEVKFSDELSDSLRKLRPEGNLLYDQVRKLQSSGKMESRVPVKKSRRYKQKITEKWTHKDFK